MQGGARLNPSRQRKGLGVYAATPAEHLLWQEVRGRGWCVVQVAGRARCAEVVGCAAGRGGARAGSRGPARARQAVHVRARAGEGVCARARGRARGIRRDRARARRVHVAGAETGEKTWRERVRERASAVVPACGNVGRCGGARQDVDSAGER